MRRSLALRIAPAATLIALAAAANPAAPVLEPGNWMFSIESVTNGRPDPTRTGEECLDAQLKDLAGYFAPKLEGAAAKCEITRKPGDKRTIDYRMNCRGDGFTLSAVTLVTLEDSRRVTIRSQLDTRTIQGEGRVVSWGEALRTGACRKP